MTDKDIQTIREIIEQAVEPAVKKYVNGKIERLTETVNAHALKHEEDMADLRPIIQSVSGAKLLGKIITWLAGLAVAYLAIKQVFL